MDMDLVSRHSGRNHNGATAVLPRRMETIYERCCGVVVLRGNEVLLLKRKKGHFDFPKGHAEPGETEIETAIRELREESGLVESCVQILPHFQECVAYNRFQTPGVKKVVKFFLARIPQTIDVSEKNTLGALLGYQWLPLHRAQRLATLPHSREILRRARRFLIDNKHI